MLLYIHRCAGVSEWQTMWTQNPLVVIPCGFDPHHRHKKEALQLVWGAFFLSAACERVEQHDPAQQGSNQPCGLLLSARETLTTGIKAHQAFAQCR